MAFGEHAQRFCTARCRSTHHTIRKAGVSTARLDCAACGAYAEGHRLMWLITEIPLCKGCVMLLRNSCWRKVRYADPDEAAGGRIRSGDEGLLLATYRCELCSGWHRTRQLVGKALFPGQFRNDDHAIHLVALRATLDGFGVTRARSPVSLTTD